MSSIKVAVASQARHINAYKCLKSKILIHCANIYFNKQCLEQNLSPKFANIKIPNTSSTAIHTQQKLTKIRLKDEIKFL